jgi:hypothetical protein
MTGQDIVMLFVTSAAALARGLAALPRALFGLGRRSRRGPRCVAVILALGLGLNGLGLCLCVPSPVKAADPHACCPSAAGHHPDMPATGNSVNASSAPCCPSQVADGFTARIDDRDALRHTLVAAAATDVSPEGRVVASVIGSAAPSLHSSSPPRTTVLRI